MTPLDRGLCLHVGLPKTGTTTLQKSFFACHSQVYYLGKNLYSPFKKRCVTNEIFQVLKPVLWGSLNQGSLHKTRELYLNKVYPGIDVDKYLLASWEGLGDYPVKIYSGMLNRLLDVFGSGRIIFTLRNPLSQVPSEYLQNLQGHFVKNKMLWMGFSPYIDIEEWFARRVRCREDAHDVLNYAQNIRVSIDILGKENVGIFLFEDLINDPEAYYRSMSKFVGVDPEETLALAKEKHLHKRISQKQVDWLKEIRKPLWKRFFLRAKSTSARRELFCQYVDQGPPAKISVPAGLRQTIEAATRDGNRWLMESYGIPLEQYGYPL